MRVLDKKVNDILRDKVIVKKLEDIGINTVGELIEYSPRELPEKGIESVYIKDISIALQCNGKDLKKILERNRRKIC